MRANCSSWKAGTGKSFLINAISNLLILNDISFIIYASTGIDAMLIKGKTVHSAFSLFNNDDEIICGLNIDKPNGISMISVKVVIIDEVSMISAVVLDAANSGLQKIMAQKNSEYSDNPFGSKSFLYLDI